eukprot:820964-Amorphochlora_amoeboformis.AAC.1
MSRPATETSRKLSGSRISPSTDRSAADWVESHRGFQGGGKVHQRQKGDRATGVCPAIHHLFKI